MCLLLAKFSHCSPKVNSGTAKETSVHKCTEEMCLKAAYTEHQEEKLTYSLTTAKRTVARDKVRVNI